VGSRPHDSPYISVFRVLNFILNMDNRENPHTIRIMLNCIVMAVLVRLSEYENWILV